MSEETKEERRKRDLMVLEREAKFFAENLYVYLLGSLKCVR